MPQEFAGKETAELVASPFLSHFSELVKPLEVDLKQALHDGSVVVDTNVLLNLYKYDEDVAEDWFKIFRIFGSRLWLPAQVIEEFWHNRKFVIKGIADHARETRGKIKSSAEKIKDDYQNWLKTRSIELGEDEKEVLEQLNGCVSTLTEKLDESLQKMEKRFDANPLNDEIAAELLELTSPESENAALVGERWSKEQLKTLYEEGQKRFKEQIPPGFMDGAVPDEGRKGKNHNKEYGDLVVWKQMIEHAKGVQGESQSSNGSMVFVTADFKRDWWSLSEGASTPDEDGFGIAHPLLAQEMWDEARCHYYQISPLQFIDLASEIFDLKISAGTKDATRNATLPSSERLFYIKSRGELRATGCITDSGAFRVFKDSRTTASNSGSFPGTSYFGLFNQLVDEGVLVPEDPELLEDSECIYVFTRNYDFSSPSAASSIVQRSSTSGRVLWRTQDGLPLGEYQDSMIDGEED